MEMKRLYLCFCLVVCAGCVQPGHRKTPTEILSLQKGNHGLGIINGNSTTIEKHPYLASISVDNSVYCAAAILGKRWLVTNAFCFTWVTLDEMSIRVGSTRWNSGGQLLSPSSVFYPPQYNYDYDYNVALIKTAKPIKFNKRTKAIKMATKEPSDGANMVASAWGATETGMKGELLEVSLNMVNRTSCKDNYLYPFPTLTNRMLCAYKENAGMCDGDEGGPLVYKNQLVGYFLGENYCAVSKAPQVFSSVANLRQWIKQTMKENS